MCFVLSQTCRSHSLTLWSFTSDLKRITQINLVFTFLHFIDVCNVMSDMSLLEKNLTPGWKAVFCCPLWSKISSLFHLWPQAASLIGVVRSVHCWTCNRAQQWSHWGLTVHLYITAARWEVKPLGVSKDKGLLSYSLISEYTNTYWAKIHTNYWYGAINQQLASFFLPGEKDRNEWNGHLFLNEFFLYISEQHFSLYNYL